MKVFMGGGFAGIQSTMAAAVLCVLLIGAGTVVLGQRNPNVPPPNVPIPSPNAPPPVVVAPVTPTQFRVGERLTYTVSKDRFRNVAYAETYVVSRGLLSGRDALELRTRFKTLNIVVANDLIVDEERTVFADPVTGMPLFIKRVDNLTVLPTQSVNDFSAAPAQHLDIATLIFRVRHSGGTGVFNIFENDRVYSVTAQATGTESVTTDAGTFETTVVSVQSEYFTSFGLTEVRVNLSNDVERIPVLAKLRAGKRTEFEIRLASVQMIVADPPETVISPIPTPVPIPTPTPVRTPEPYIDNQPLADTIAFVLGERLEYNVMAGARPAGRAVLQARERKQVNGVDSLLLTADVMSVVSEEQALRAGDLIRAQVDPTNLSPQQTEMQFRGALAGYSQTAAFDPQSSAISLGGGTRINAPVGTHSMMSLLYAMRSFSLRPPVNPMSPPEDTRVAVLWGNQTYVFAMRPLEVTSIEVAGQNVLAQQVNITTGDPQLDQLNMRVWLSADRSRVPLRISIGIYQADLISRTVVAPR